MPQVIDVADLHNYLTCDFSTGRMFWKIRPAEMFEQEFVAKRWNDRYAGKEAFTSNDNGYRVGNINRVRYQAHRVVFALGHGRWPSALIDHIDLDRSNNRLDNLREATRQQNTWNKGLTVQNASGFKGVSLDRGTGRWISQVQHMGKVHFIGRFDSPEDAAFAYDAKAIELHGEFAHLNFPRCPIVPVAAFAVEQNNRRYKRMDPNMPRRVTVMQPTGRVTCPATHPVYVAGKGCRK